MKWHFKIYKRQKGFALGNLNKTHYDRWEFDLGFWWCEIWKDLP
jgi:hypothetical protein